MYQRRNLGDVYTNPDRSVIFTNLVMYTITSKIKKKDFKRVCTRSVCTKIREKFICNTSEIGFIIRDIISLNCTFSILPLAEPTNLKVYLTLYHWLLKQVFYMIKILFFILISRYGCFGFLSVCMYVSKLSQWSYTARIIMVP